MKAAGCRGNKGTLDKLIPIGRTATEQIVPSKLSVP